MRKLFAMLLVLCLMCGAVGAGAENPFGVIGQLGAGAQDIVSEEFMAQYNAAKKATGTQTSEGFTFDIPAGWTADLSMTKEMVYQIYKEFYGTDFVPASKENPYSGLLGDGIKLTNEADPTSYISVIISQVTQQNNKKIMETYNNGVMGLGMVSPAEIVMYSRQQIHQSGTLGAPKMEFVTIGSFLGEPVRRTYSGFIGEYIDENGNAQKARVSAVVWSSEMIGKEIVIQQITSQGAENFDCVVDEFMKSFRYEDHAGTYDEGAATDAQKMVSADDFIGASIEPAKTQVGEAAYLFDLTAPESDVLDFFYRHIFLGSQDFSYAGGLNLDGLNLDDIDLNGLFQGGSGLGGFGTGDNDWSSGGLGGFFGTGDNDWSTGTGDFDWTGGGLGGFDW